MKIVLTGIVARYPFGKWLNALGYDVYCLEDTGGQVVEMGSYKELIAKKRLYSSLYETQLV